MNVTYHISWHVNEENLSSDIWKVENTFMSFSNTRALMDAYDIPYEKSIRKMLYHHIIVSSDKLQWIEFKQILHDIIFIHISQILSAVGLIQTLVTTSKYLH